MVVLDFSQLPDLSIAPFFISFGRAAEKALAKLPEVAGRAEAAMRFCWFTYGDERILYGDDYKTARLREAFLRACLAEYRSLDEVLPRDLTNLGITQAPFRLIDSPKPLLHVMKELRNLEFHLFSSRLSPRRKVVMQNFRGKVSEEEITIWCTEDLTVDRFRALRNARFYAERDIIRLIDWFNEAQQIWGVNHLAHVAITTLAEDILTKHCLWDAADGDV